MKFDLSFSRAREKTDPETGMLSFDPNDEIWRVDWKSFGFDFGGVYLITPKSGWPVKIGNSCYVERRLSELQTAHWNELIVSRYWMCETKKHAARVEVLAHDRIATAGGHLLGEWFDMRAPEAAGIVESTAAELGVELATRLPVSERFHDVFFYLEEGVSRRSRVGEAVKIHAEHGGDVVSLKVF